MEIKENTANLWVNWTKQCNFNRELSQACADEYSA